MLVFLGVTVVLLCNFSLFGFLLLLLFSNLVLRCLVITTVAGGRGGGLEPFLKPCFSYVKCFVG